MNIFKLDKKMIIILIIAFFIVVALLAALAALSSKDKESGGNNGGPQPATQPNQNQTNTTNTQNTVTNTSGGGGVSSLTGFDKYDDQAILEIYFGTKEIDSITEYSVAGMNMTKAKDKVDFDITYSKEIPESDLEDLVKEFKKTFVEENCQTYDLDEIDLTDLEATKLLVVNEEFYFGINGEYAYARNGMDVAVYDLTDNLKRFALELPEEVDTSFSSFRLFLEIDNIDISFDDQREVNQIKENFYSYEVDLNPEDYGYLGYMEFDNGNKLEIYEDRDYYIGKYESGRDSKVVMLNKDSIDIMLNIVREAMG